MKTYAIGIDLGATTIKAGVVDASGAILKKITLDSKAGKGPSAVIQQIVFSIRELLNYYKQAECLGIGIGTPGIVSINREIVSYPPNFTDWKEVELKKAITKLFQLNVIIENDANAAALAEIHYGTGTKYKDFIFVIWGTGVGGGIVINKKLFRGRQGGAGEIGHVSIDYNGPQCNCGNRGCIESYIGQRYLSQRVRELLTNSGSDEIKSTIVDLVDGNLNRIDPAIIAAAAEQNDSIACGILQQASELLGYALASVVNLFDIRVIVIGGGLSGAPKFVFAQIESSIRSRVLMSHKSSIKVLQSTMGNSAGMIGAASLVILKSRF